RVEQTDTPFTAACQPGQVLSMPIAHGDGNYFCDPETLVELESEGRVIFRYCDAGGRATEASNPNGALANIAGICNRERNVLGMMPHPERASEDLLNSHDGRVLFRSLAVAVGEMLDQITANRGEMSRSQQLRQNSGAFFPIPQSATRNPQSKMSEPVITPEILAQHNVTPEEYERIRQLMGREPNFTELGIFSVMWSEHCSYKSSKVHLKRLPVEGDCLVQGPGENAGIVDIGDGWCVAFKIESHNHPSFIEPYQGAATGVGGILRDIFTMGARPVAAMDSLRFGPIRDEGVDESKEQ